jgi:hypothetical protein
MTIHPESAVTLSVTLSAICLGLIAIGGFRSGTATFGRKIAPYCLTASICMFAAVLLGWLAALILDTSIASQ